MRINNHILSLVTVCAVLIGSTGCSQRISALNDTIKLAFIGDNDATLTPEQIRANPYASIYAKIGETAQAFVVLAFAEPPATLSSTAATTAGAASLPPHPLELKWLSADNGMIVTVNGRVVKTHNLLEGNLAGVSSAQRDPILQGLHLESTPKHWRRMLDWQPGYHYGYQADSQFQFVATETIIINQTPTQVLHYSELVTVKGLNIQYQNEFWLKPDNGQVVKSRQKIAPNLPFIDITLLKPFAS